MGSPGSVKAGGRPKLQQAVVVLWASRSYETGSIATDSRWEGQEMRKPRVVLPERAQPVGEAGADRNGRRTEPAGKMNPARAGSAPRENLLGGPFFPMDTDGAKAESDTKEEGVRRIRRPRDDGSGRHHYTGWNRRSRFR